MATKRIYITPEEEKALRAVLSFTDGETEYGPDEDPHPIREDLAVARRLLTKLKDAGRR